MLALDPWAFTQEQIRGTTLKAAQVLYYEQAVRARRQSEPPRTSATKYPPTIGRAEVFPGREEWIAAMEGRHGKVKDFGADWDILNAAGGFKEG